MAGMESIEVPIRVKAVDVPVNVQLNVGLSLEVEGEAQSNFDDVGDFHDKFQLPTAHDEAVPQLLEPGVQDYRVKFLREELKEFTDAWDAADLSKAFDALLDLVYVALGTAHMMGLPWQEGWDEVQRANMTKVRASSREESAAATGRGHELDVIKPEGWTPPDIEGVLARHG